MRIACALGSLLAIFAACNGPAGGTTGGIPDSSEHIGIVFNDLGLTADYGDQWGSADTPLGTGIADASTSGDTGNPDLAGGGDAGSGDAGSGDAGGADAGSTDAGIADAGAFADAETADSSVPDGAPVDDCTLTPLYRYWNGDLTDHFYDIEGSLLGDDNRGYKYERVEACVCSQAGDEVAPFYRYWNGTTADHFYTTDWTALGNGKSGYVSEGNEGYLYKGEADGRIPLYRYWNGTTADHFYTTDWSALGNGKSGYGYERIEGYVLPACRCSACVGP